MLAQVILAPSTLAQAISGSMDGFDLEDAPAVVEPDAELEPPRAVARPQAHGVKRVVCIFSGGCELDSASGLCNSELLAYVNRWRSEIGLPAWAPRARRPAHVFHGVAVAGWTLLDDDTAPTTSHAAVQIRALLGPGAVGFFDYEFFGGAAVAEAVRTDPVRQDWSTLVFHAWATSSLGNLSCVGGGTVLSAIESLRIQELLPQARLYRLDVHSAIAPLVVRGMWKHDFRAISCPPVLRGQRYSVFPAGHQQLWMRSRAVFHYKPSKGLLASILAYLQGRSDWTMPAEDAPVVPDSMEVDIPSANQMVQRGGGLPALRAEYPFWQRVDAILAGGGVRSCMTLGKFARRCMVSKFGDAGAKLWDLANLRGARDPSSQLLQVGRVRLDMAIMLYHRDYAPLGDETTREVGVDATPGGRREILVLVEVMITFSSPDADCRPTIVVRRFAAVNLGHKHAKAHDKGMAALHMVWNDYGPTEGRIRRWCRSCKSVLTDLGPEALWANSRNTVPAMFGRPLDPNVDDEFLFPFALKWPGTQHMLDSCLREVVLKDIPWYSDWVPELKTIAKTLGYTSYTDVLVASLRSQSQHDYARVLESPIEDFQQWRWGSLVRCSRDVQKRKDAAKAGWVDSEFDLKGEQLHTTSKLLKETAAANTFWLRLSFILLVFGPLEDLRGWVRGCACCVAARMRGSRNVCQYAGRRARWLREKIQQLVESLQHFATEYRHAHPWIDVEGFSDLLQTCVAALTGIIHIKFAFLWNLPYFCIGMRDQAIAADCLERRDALAAAGRRLHRVTECFLFSVIRVAKAR